MDLTLVTARVDAHRARACVRWQCAQLPAHAQRAAACTAE